MTSSAFSFGFPTTLPQGSNFQSAGTVASPSNLLASLQAAGAVPAAFLSSLQQLGAGGAGTPGLAAAAAAAAAGNSPFGLAGLPPIGTPPLLQQGVLLPGAGSQQLQQPPPPPQVPSSQAQSSLPQPPPLGLSLSSNSDMDKKKIAKRARMDSISK